MDAWSGPRGRDFIESLIPHRPPFLLLDQVLDLGEGGICASWRVPADLDILRGHYPGHPIVPGVLLCESVFQAGALLIASEIEGPVEGVPVLTRILGARFKREAGPGDLLEVRAAVSEQVGPAWFCKGGILRQGKRVLGVEFACALKRG